MRKIYWGIFILLLFNSKLQAGGFEFPIHSIKLAGIGNAGSALAWDASCLQFNSANMAFLNSKMSIAIGTNTFWANLAYQNKETQTTQYNKTFPISVPSFFFTYKINNKFSTGFNLTFNYGSENDWGNDFQLSAIANYLSLNTLVPTIHGSYKFNNNFSFGANIALSYFSAEFSRVLREVTEVIDIKTPPSVNIQGTGVSWEAGVGVTFQSNNKSWLASLEYKYSADIRSNYSGNASLKNISDAYKENIPNGNIMTTLNMPQRISIGISKKIEKITLAFSSTFYDWTRMKKISIHFLDDPFKEGENATSEYDLHLRWVLHLNIGAQYEIKKFSLRAGTSYNNTAANKDYISPLLPLDNQITLHMGLSYKLHPKLDIDFCYLYTHGFGFDGDNKALGISETKFQTLINTLGVGLNYHL